MYTQSVFIIIILSVDWGIEHYYSFNPQTVQIIAIIITANILHQLLKSLYLQETQFIERRVVRQDEISSEEIHFFRLLSVPFTWSLRNTEHVYWHYYCRFHSWAQPSL